MPPKDWTEAVTVTLPAALPVRTVVATPLAFVFTDVCESVARVLLLRLKLTVAFATGLPLLSLTDAVMLDVFPAVIVDGVAATVTLPLAAPDVIVIKALAAATPDTALMVTTELENVVAVKVIEAVPLTVVALPADNLALTWSPGAKEKLTAVPSGTLLPRSSTTWAVMTVEPEGAIVEGFAVRASAVADEAVVVGPVMTVPALLLFTFEGEQLIIMPSKINSPTTMANLSRLIKSSKTHTPELFCTRSSRCVCNCTRGYFNKMGRSSRRRSHQHFNYDIATTICSRNDR